MSDDEQVMRLGPTNYLHTEYTSSGPIYSQCVGLWGTGKPRDLSGYVEVTGFTSDEPVRLVPYSSHPANYSGQVRYAGNQPDDQFVRIGGNDGLQPIYVDADGVTTVKYVMPTDGEPVDLTGLLRNIPRPFRLELPAGFRGYIRNREGDL